jgi:hypothetical protein
MTQEMSEDALVACGGGEYVTHLPDISISRLAELHLN